MFIMDYIVEQQDQNGPEQQNDSQIEIIKKLIIVDIFYKLYTAIRTSNYQDRGKITFLLDNILRFSPDLSYDTLVSLLRGIVDAIENQNDKST